MADWSDEAQRAAAARGEFTDADLLHEIGTTGLVRFGGYINEEFLPQLKGTRGRKTIREMVDNDPAVGATLLTTDLMMRQVKFSVSPVKDQVTTGATPSSTQAQEAADLCWSALHDMEDPFPDTLSSILSMLPFGFSWHEEVYKYRNGMDPGIDEDGEPLPTSRYRDGRMGWRNLPVRAQETLYQWDYSDKGRLRGFIQQAAPDYRTNRIHAAKSMHFRTTALKGNPEGRSILRNAYRPWYFKRRIEEIEAIGIERDLAGIPMIEVPPELLVKNPTDDAAALRDRLEKMVRNVRRNEAEGIMMPLQYDGEGNQRYRFTLVTSGGKRNFDTGAVIARCDQRIVMCALADFIMLGHEGVSGGLGDGGQGRKQDLFSAAIDAWLGQICTEFSEVGFPRLLKYNGLPPELAPTLEHGQVQQIDLDVIGNFILHLTQSGAPIWTPGDPASDELLETLFEMADLPSPVSGGGEV